MDPSRRLVIAGLGALAACPADSTTTPSERAPEPPRWTGAAEVDLAAFAWGVSSGDAGTDGALLVVRTLEPALRLVVVRGDGQEWVADQELAELVPVDGVVHVALSGLGADHVYAYQFTSADGARGSEIGRLRTAIDAPRRLVFGASSCFGNANPEFPGIAHAAAESLDFFVLLGDSVYADGAVTTEDYRGFWRAFTSKTNVRALTASTSLVATWDDHEVNNNWFVSTTSPSADAVTEDQVANGAAMFHEALPIPPASESLWRSLVWGDVLELIVLDCRGERNHVDEIVSPAQLAWAIDRIRTSPATFKAVLVSVHMTDHTAIVGALEADDRWQGYPAQRDAIVAAAAETPGTFFVTGDMHYGGVQHLAPEGEVGGLVVEIAAGPSGSEPFPVGLIEDPPPQYLDVVEDWTWARFELDPGAGTVRVQLIDDAGVALVDRVFTP